MTGIPINYGGYTCLVCGSWVATGSMHICGSSPPMTNFPLVPITPVGWRCPVCNAGLAPWMTMCPMPHPPAAKPVSEDRTTHE